MTTASVDLAALASELETLHARLLASAPELAPEVERALERLRIGLEELHVADRDVTERVQAERALWELNADLEQRVASRTADLDNERAQLQELLRQMPVGVLVGDRSGRALRPMNSRAAELLAPADGGVDDRLLQLRYPDGREVPKSELPSIRAAATREPVLNVRYVLDSGDGRRTLDVSAGPVLAPDGSLSAVVVMLDDVTSSVRKEEADRDFVSNAAHQIRTPITAIVSAVAALQAGAKDEPAHRDRFLAHIARESDRLARLAEALLMLSRFARGEGPAEVRVVALDPLLRQLAAAAGERVTVRCRRDAAAITSASLLEQALSNVIDNALKHADGQVTVSVRRRRDRVVIEVADRGPGMDAAQRERAVERFFRARNDGSGFGLGLAIAADAVRAAGAELEIESEPGNGTRVRIAAPGARLETGRRA
jgi:signal transduction histidine kinase